MTRYSLYKSGQWYTEIDTNDIQQDMKEYHCDSYKEIIPTPEEIKEAKLKAIREYRDKLMEDCDYIFLSDNQASETTIQLYLIYRQLLRDITSQEDLDNIIWPTKPKYIKKEVG